MSKKKFTSGLDSLFGTLTEEAFQEESPLLDDQETNEAKPEAKPKKKKLLSKRSSKNFTSDLETLFEQALVKTIEEKQEKANRKDSIRKRLGRKSNRPIGLDALIRRKTDMEVVEVNIPTKTKTHLGSNGLYLNFAFSKASICAIT